MSIGERIVRSIKELLGMKQWPRRQPARVANRDEFFLARLIRKGDVVYDVGANHGSLACFMASLCGINGKVVAFEPVWRVYERMCERLQAESVLRAPIITVPLGLSDQAGVAEIHLPDGADCLASTAPLDRVRQMHRTTEVRSLRCGLIPLDTFVETTGIQPPQLVKIDVEGAECKVLAGGRRVFEGPDKPILFIELVAPWLRQFGYSPWDAVGYLQTLGYRHLFMCPDGLVEHLATPERPFPPEFRMGYNVISYVPACHPWVLERLAPYLASRNPRLPPMDPATLPNE